MTHRDDNIDARRKFLKLVSGSAVLLPLAGLSACSGGDESAPATSGSAAPEPSPEPESKPAMAEEAPADEPAAEQPAAGEPAAEPGGDMPRLDENSQQAQSLGYVHDATTVDASKFPRYEEGQACSNCALWQGGDAEWGGCSIFPGRKVKATGWCNVYAPKAG